MAKVRTFLDKLRKMSEFKAEVCPECNTEIQRVMVVRSQKAERTGGWRFNREMVNLCKCNEKEVYG
jgi:uncharacterized protein with PIN domain